MLLQKLVNGGAIPAMDKMLAFTQARHKMLVENVANADNPHYRTKQLDPKQFQASLREALDARKETRSPAFRMNDTRQFRQGDDGRLVVTPTPEPVENLLFHDGTNVRIERQMAMLGENAMMHEAVSELLRGKYQGMLKAIRGRVT